MKDTHDKMIFKEKSIILLCDWEYCAKKHIRYYLSEKVEICKKLAIHSNAVIHLSKNDTLVKNLNEYLFINERFVR